MSPFPRNVVPVCVAGIVLAVIGFSWGKAGVGPRILGFAIGAFIAFIVLVWTTSKLRSQFSRHIVEAEEIVKAAEVTGLDKLAELRNELESKTQELVLVREQRRIAGEQLDVAQSELKQAQASVKELSSIRARLDAEIRLRVAAETKLEDLEINLKQQEKLLHEPTARLAGISALSAEALKGNTQAFLAMAKSTLETIHAQAKDDVQSMIVSLVAPLKESLDNYGQQVVKMEKSRGYMYGRLDEQLKIMGDASRQLQEEIGLVTALRAPQTYEHLVETKLRRIARSVGASEQRDFDAHETFSAGNGRQRPDAGHGPNAIAAAWSSLLGWLRAPMRSSNIERWHKFKTWFLYGS
jgi:RmuC family